MRSRAREANGIGPEGVTGLSYPPTVVVVHDKERVSKCTLAPLRGRPDLRFVRFDPRRSIELSGYVRLAPAGPALSEADARCGLLLLDGSWRWAERMARHFEHVPARALKGYRTAYPRRSNWYPDPAEGLASVEALYVAYRILGRPLDGLLDHYRWADEFLRLNGWA